MLRVSSDGSRFYKTETRGIASLQRREGSPRNKNRDARHRVSTKTRGLETKTEMRGIAFLQRCEGSRFYKTETRGIASLQRCEGSRFYKNRDARHRVSTKTGCWRIKKCLLFLAIFLAVVEPIDGRKRRWHSIMPDVFLVQ